MNNHLAERAARLWLAWNPTKVEPCPGDVADAITEWAEAVAAENKNKQREVERGRMTEPTKHAPGPWSIVDNRDMNGAYWIEAEHPEGFSVSIAEVRQGCGEAEEIGNVEANARIIAAAPLTLAALEGLAALDRTPDEFATPEIRAARAAIALAKGQS